MFLISKAQFNQLAANTKAIEAGRTLHCLPLIKPHGSQQSPLCDLGVWLIKIDEKRPNYARCVDRYLTEDGSEHETTHWVEIKIYRSKFLADLAAAFEFWHHLRRW